jgi:hypothetical protein
MLIGKDYPKIEFDLFGLELLEPNAFIGDTIIFLIALYLAYKTSNLSIKNSFFTYWKWFFIIFGFGFFAGGIGHMMYNYFGVPGKYLSWYGGILASFFVEKAIISIFSKVSWKPTLNAIVVSKLVLAIIAATYVFATVDLTVDPQKGLIVPTLNSIIGLSLSLGVLGYYYQLKIDSSFRYLWMSTLILIPSAVFQAKKINFHQWFDRNDVSHILLITSMFMYFICIEKYAKSLLLEKKGG